MPKILNVGGGASRELPEHFKGWNLDVLDIDPTVSPDIVLNAMNMAELPAEQYDAVLCSHALEHFYKHDVPKVLHGFLHVLKAAGVAEIIVPSLTQLFANMSKHSLDIGDVWYRTSSGTPITFHDVLYGWNHAMDNGNLFYSHKCGFTMCSLGEAVSAAGFKGAQLWDDGYNLYCRAYKEQPCPQQ